MWFLTSPCICFTVNLSSPQRTCCSSHESSLHCSQSMIMSNRTTWLALTIILCPLQWSHDLNHFCFFSLARICTSNEYCIILILHILSADNEKHITWLYWVLESNEYIAFRCSVLIYTETFTRKVRQYSRRYNGLITGYYSKQLYCLLIPTFSDLCRDLQHVLTWSPEQSLYPS